MRAASAWAWDQRQKSLRPKMTISLSLFLPRLDSKTPLLKTISGDRSRRGWKLKFDGEEVHFPLTLGKDSLYSLVQSIVHRGVSTLQTCLNHWMLKCGYFSRARSEASWNESQPVWAPTFLKVVFSLSSCLFYNSLLREDSDWLIATSVEREVVRSILKSLSTSELFTCLGKDLEEGLIFYKAGAPYLSKGKNDVWVW